MKTNTDIAIRFLRAVRWRGPWTLTALVPDTKGAPTETFINVTELAKMREWINRHNAGAGVYFCANPTSKRMHRRPIEEDIAALQYVALDFDPRKDESPLRCRTRVFKLLDELEAQPTFRWSTGNGVQALWKVKPAVMLVDKATRVRCRNASLGLIQALNADHTQSLEHLFRLPGTINYPNKTKLALGRKAVVAGDFEYDPENTYSLDDFPASKTPLRVMARGVVEPPGGWNTTDGIQEAIFYLRTTRDTAAEGRAGTAIRTALRVRDYGLSQDFAFELMWEHWVPRCDYIWEDEELRGKIQRAYERAQNDPGCRTKPYRLLIAKKDFCYE